MITRETAASCLAEYTKFSSKDRTYILQMVAEVYSEEPHFSAFVMSIFNSGTKIDPHLAAILCHSLYQRMKKAQDHSEKLKGEIGPTE